MDDAGYARCLDTLVKACNDLLLTHRGKVFLGKRTMYPQRDWWMACGGRMRPGESVFDASRRLLQRELRLDLSLSQLRTRLQTVGSYTFVWAKRAQEPQTNGTADVSVVVALELTDDEVASIRTEDEYGQEAERTAWRAISEVLDPAQEFHPALVRSVQDYVKLRRFQQLEALLLGTEAGQPIPSVPEHPLPLQMAAAGATAACSASTDAPLSDAQLLARVREYFLYSRCVAAQDTESVPCKET